MDIIDGEKFKEWISEAGRIAEPFIKASGGISARQQAEQGAREIADKYRAENLQPEGLQAGNVDLGVMVMGAIFRSGLLPQNDSRMKPLVEDIRRTQERLRRAPR